MMNVHKNGPQKDGLSAGIIWITGFSGAGKTTVGRKVVLKLSELGVHVIFMDGDDLRAIFGGKWGYERSDRIALAHAYFRLCSSLVAQGVTVVLSAVAMYNELYEWVRTNLDRTIIVYLRVPEQERLRRDQVTKRVYAKMGDLSQLYEEPPAPDLTIDNFGGSTPDQAATRIVNYYCAMGAKASSDRGRTAHWQSYYQSSRPVFEPSSFAHAVSGELSWPVELLEVGCGNGRDAVFFSKLGHKVVAIDASSSAIDLCREKHNAFLVHFVHAKLPDIWRDYVSRFDVIYNRFCLHAMTVAEELEMLNASRDILKPWGRLFIECRSINDPLARLGEIISPTERIFGHYRRFIVLDELVARLKSTGFNIISMLESSGLAVFGDEDPVVIRIVAERGA